MVDHHVDEGGVSALMKDEQRERPAGMGDQDKMRGSRVIEKCGSCTSLVVRELQATWDALSASALSSGAGHGQGDDGIRDDAALVRVWDAQVAKMALASILIDTRNLTDATKTTDTDREAVKYLEAKINLSPNDARSWDRTTFYEEINAAESNIDPLELKDILRKDYKEWTEAGMKLGISSVVRPLDFLVRKAKEESRADGKAKDGDAENAFDTAIASFITSRNLSLYAIMTTYTNTLGDFQRQLLLQSSNPATDRAAAHFEKTATEELELEPVSLELGISDHAEEGCWRKVWQLRNVGASRKQVAPLLRKAMGESGGDG